MSQNVAAPTSSEANIFQKYLIPPDSKYTRMVMQKAGDYGRDGNFFTSRAVSVALATVAVAFSFFNAISYLLQAPVKILLNIVQFNPIALITDLIGDLTNMLRSLVFVSLGMTFVVAGVLFPKAIFTHFAPDYEVSMEEKLKIENENLRRILQNPSIIESTDESGAARVIAIAGRHLAEAQTEIENLQRRIHELEGVRA